MKIFESTIVQLKGHSDEDIESTIVQLKGHSDEDIRVYYSSTQRTFK